MKQPPLRWFVAFLFLLFCIGIGLWLRRDKSAVRALVQVELWSGYVLPLNEDDTLYFAEATAWDREREHRDSVRLFRGMHTLRKEALLHKVVKGFRVAHGGQVSCVLPTLFDTLRGEKLLELLRNSERATRARVALMKHQRSELAYYRRTHSVADDGYNEVMAFAAQHHRRLKNEQACWALLRKALQKASLVAVKQHRLRVDGAAYLLEEAREGFSLLRPVAGRVARRPMGGKELLAFLRPPVDSLWRHTDSAGTHYRLLRRDSLWQGTATTAQGLYYEGTFDDSLRRHGFGFGLDERLVKCGIWERNHFHGERMLYNAQRIYGIDISRYQHEQGGKVYPIDWARLRITHLGTISKKRVQGRVDYPVRFIFIKATQGTSITSRYYATDLRAARAHGFPVAPYHFFSPKLNGAAQALHFMRHARLSEATLPPMLDVEPTPAEIERMGGIEILFREMREWLTMVERVAGRRPVLYLPQYFINRYMDQAPDWLRAYDVWIARYGEYKPYVRLLLWQLSPDGRVQGIRGEVDLNVFNGTEPDFQRWLEGR